MVQEAVSFMKTTPVVATGCFRIGELAAAMRRCSLVITNDSGPDARSYQSKGAYRGNVWSVQSEAVRSLY